MSTYSNRLQPALQNLLQHVVRFILPLSCYETYSVLSRSPSDINYKQQSRLSG